MMKSPEQSLFDTVYQAILDLGYNVYDYLPPQEENVRYPFVVVGAVESVGNANKTALINKVSIHIDVWGTKENRIEVSTITDAIYMKLVNGLSSTEYSYKPRYNDNIKQLMQDTSVPNQVFNRGMLDLAYQY